MLDALELARRLGVEVAHQLYGVEEPELDQTRTGLLLRKQLGLGHQRQRGELRRVSGAPANAEQLDDLLLRPGNVRDARVLDRSTDQRGNVHEPGGREAAARRVGRNGAVAGPVSELVPLFVEPGQRADQCARVEPQQLVFQTEARNRPSLLDGDVRGIHGVAVNDIGAEVVVADQLVEADDSVCRTAQVVAAVGHRELLRQRIGDDLELGRIAGRPVFGEELRKGHDLIGDAVGVRLHQHRGQLVLDGVQLLPATRDEVVQGVVVQIRQQCVEEAVAARQSRQDGAIASRVVQEVVRRHQIDERGDVLADEVRCGGGCQQRTIGIAHGRATRVQLVGVLQNLGEHAASGLQAEVVVQERVRRASPLVWHTALDQQVDR